MSRIRCVLDLQGVQGQSRSRGIGRYSLNLAKAMVQQSGDHEVWIVLNELLGDSIDSLRRTFDAFVPQKRIVTFTAPSPVAGDNSANAWRRNAAELIRERFVASLSPDIVHVSSIFDGYQDDTVASVGLSPSAFATAVTLYDLIPFLRADEHLWNSTLKNHHLRKAHYLKRADLLLAISESSRQEAIDVLNIPAEHVVNISAGIDEIFKVTQYSSEFVQDLYGRLGIRRNFVMYSGALDPRKNLEGLIQAFAQLPEPLRSSYQLVFVGGHDSVRRQRLEELGRRLGLGENLPLFLGHASDTDLVALYNLCSLFVFPSFHEGFGLPPLEAMACGAPTIASNLTSLSEILGSSPGAIDPHQPGDISRRMHDALTDSAFREALREHGLQQSGKFTWQRVAEKTWSAFEELHRRHSSATTASFAPSAAQAKKLRLAYFSPLPPERSGISDYSAELLPELARFYEIDVIVQQDTVSDDWINANFGVHDLAFFREHRLRYDRILYHIGNSPFHIYMLDTLRRYPGVVVLHDFFQSGVLNWMETIGGCPDQFSQAVYESHGYSGLLRAKEQGREWAVRTLPCNRHVIDAAAGIIVHSDFSRKLAEVWYGSGFGSDWKVVPFPRSPKRIDRDSARQRLGLAPDDYVVCSFGLIDPTKLNRGLLASWQQSRLSRSATCKLIFVGENHGGQYGNDLRNAIAASDSMSGKVSITGYVSLDSYRDYLAAADCAVQLRTNSRGETSAALLDCMAYGLPTIVNSNGAFAEIPDRAALKLPDDFSDTELASALEQLWLDADYRGGLSHRASELVRLEHHPARVAELYRDAIETFATSHPIALEQNLLADISLIQADDPPSADDLLSATTSIAAFRTGRPPQFLLDVSATATNNLKTGIERATVHLTSGFFHSVHDFRVEPVRFEDGRWKYARDLCLRALGASLELEETAATFRQGDIYLGLDWCPEAVFNAQRLFAELRAKNIPTWFVVYDLLPVLKPQMFPSWAADQFLKWLTILCESADGLACISRSVADELLSFLDIERPQRQHPLKVGYFHLGADFANRVNAQPLSADNAMLDRAMQSRTSLLMVGTVEPRKGHQLALASLEKLWAAGIDLNLIIVGKQGWNVDAVSKKLRAHRESGRRLFWLSDTSDETLAKLYQTSSALLAASEGEGFGIPLIEAARHKLPIIARDIPVFREVAGDCAFYFGTSTPESLAADLRSWLELYSKAAAPSSEGLRFLTWKESAEQLANVVLGERIYMEWMPQPQLEKPRGAMVYSARDV